MQKTGPPRRPQQLIPRVACWEWGRLKKYGMYFSQLWIPHKVVHGEELQARRLLLTGFGKIRVTNLDSPWMDVVSLYNSGGAKQTHTRGDAPASSSASQRANIERTANRLAECVRVARAYLCVFRHLNSAVNARELDLGGFSRRQIAAADRVAPRRLNCFNLVLVRPGTNSPRQYAHDFARGRRQAHTALQRPVESKPSWRRRQPGQSSFSSEITLRARVCVWACTRACAHGRAYKYLLKSPAGHC